MGVADVASLEPRVKVGDGGAVLLLEHCWMSDLKVQLKEVGLVLMRLVCPRELTRELFWSLHSQGSHRVRSVFGSSFIF